MIISPTIAGAYHIRVKNTRILNHSVRLRRMFTKEEKIDSVKNDGYIYKDMYFQEIRVLNRETDIEIKRGGCNIYHPVEIGMSEADFIKLLNEISEEDEIMRIAQEELSIPAYDKSYKAPLYDFEPGPYKVEPATRPIDINITSPSSEDTSPLNVKNENEEILTEIASEVNKIAKDVVFDLVDEPITIQAPVQPPAMEAFNEEIKKATDPITEEDHVENTDPQTEEVAATKESTEQVAESKVIKPVIQQNNRQVHPNINNRPQYNNKNKK